MPAPFVFDLCGYRDGRPNTSDSSQPHSVEIGLAFFEKIGVPKGSGAGKVDKLWNQRMVEDLRYQLREVAPHLVVESESSPHEFEQYAHLKALRELSEDLSSEVELALSGLKEDVTDRYEDLDRIGAARIAELVDALDRAQSAAEVRRRSLADLLGDESLLRLDVAVNRPAPVPNPSKIPHLVAGFSLKWSLRTDRLQDPRTQGAKMASLRRGRMPHFAAVTMEPRPYMLGRMGRGSGDLDCVYHLHLPALMLAVNEVYKGKPARVKMRDMFNRMVEQRRLLDYDDLVAYLATL